MKRLLILVIVIVITSVAQARLVGWWKLDEGSGRTAYDSTGNNHGTIHGAKWTTGQVGSALSFDGTDDYLNCGNDASLDIIDEITIEAWVKGTYENGTYHMIVKKYDPAYGSRRGYGLYVFNHKICFRLGMTDDSLPTLEGTALTDQSWYHIVGTYDKENMKIYVNGNLNAHTPETRSIKGGSSLSLLVGAYPPHYLKGLIDEVGVYNRALSAKEVQQRYQYGLNEHSYISNKPVFAPIETGQGKIDLVILPTRDTVQLTIYNSADLTLVRESRDLTLKTGENKLQFSWANTLIDPTSLEMLPKANADKINIADLTYPPRVRNLGLWNIDSEVSGKVPVEITYLTSGLSWRAFYMGTLTKDESTMRLQAYVRVTNNSGEDYENAQTRLIVGKIHILDQIAQLARRQYPYDRPGIPEGETQYLGTAGRAPQFKADVMKYAAGARSRPAEIKKEGLSEYFLYTIEGTETIPTGWSKRLLSFDAKKVPVVNLYKYEQRRYGNSVVRFLSFKNDTEHDLGETPIPGGMLKVYRTIDQDEHLSYVGQSSFKYIPVDEDVELNLGPVADVVVEPTLMDYKTENYMFNRHGNISGWDEVRTFKVEVRNTRDIDVKVEIKRRFDTDYWKLEKGTAFKYYDKVDKNTVKFTLLLEPRTKKQFNYILRTYHGVRREEWQGNR